MAPGIVWYLPVAHKVHSVPANPKVSMYFPASQGLQDIPSFSNVLLVPGEHGKHSEALSRLLYLPASQSMQLVEPHSAYLPGVQS